MSTPAAAVLDGQPAAPPAGATPAANQPAFFDSWVKPDAPEGKEIREWLGNKNFPDPATLVKSYRGLETEASTLRAAANLKGYPADKVDQTTGQTVKADENQVKAWRTTMGVPETADKYDIKLPSTSPFPQFANYLKEGMHQVGVPAAMAGPLSQIYEAAVSKLETEIRTKEDGESKLKLAELQNAWGSNYQERVALAGRGKEWIAKEVGGLNDLQMRTLEATLGTDKFMTMMWKFGAGNKEPGFAGSNGNPSTFGNTASAAQAEIDQITANRSAGKISDLEWRTKAEPRMMELVQIVSGGMAK